MADVTGELLRAAWSALGGEASLLDLVEVTGSGEGLLPSTLHALPAMVAAVSASTLAASVLEGARRTGPPARVRVDVQHVALAARSERYARTDGSPQAELFAPLSRFWRTADGWLRLHTNYAWHRERALRVLGCWGAQDSPEVVGEAVQGWRGEDLEDALAAAGAVGYAVRTRAQWQAHRQGRAVAALPLLDGIPVARSGRRADGGAAGVARVLDLTRVIAGPVATRTLAAWGADVLRLDPPQLPEIPAQALDTLPGKRSAQLDFCQPPGRARLDELLTEADVLVQGYRLGALVRYGLDPDELALRHPHLSVVTLSAWGTAGPWAARRGFDSMVQCAAGIAAAEGNDGEPGALPAQVLDHATGYLAAAAALLALADVQRGQGARAVWLSLAQTAHWLTGAGTTRRQPARELRPWELSPWEHLVTLPGARHPVQVVAPPGQVGEQLPTWTSSTDLGSDPAAFRGAEPPGSAPH